MFKNLEALATILKQMGEAFHQLARTLRLFPNHFMSIYRGGLVQYGGVMKYDYTDVEQRMRGGRVKRITVECFTAKYSDALRHWLNARGYNTKTDGLELTAWKE